MTDPPAPVDRIELPRGVAAVATECADLVSAFAAAGHRLYLVGGIVRDLIGGARPDDLGPPADAQPDFDFTTDADPTQVKAVVGPIADSVWNQGERFGTIAAKFGDRLVEITTHRAEAYDPDSRKPAVVFSDDVRSDLSRRDFTINAMAIELTAPSPALLDPFDGIAHLRDRILRTPLSPTESFSDDPLRMLRAARFVARLGLTPDADVVAAMTAMGDRVSVVSAERIRDELDKLLLVDDPRPGLRLLVDTGLSERFLPELALGGEEACARRLTELAASAPTSIVRWSVLLLDGGSDAARRRLRALKQPTHVGRDVAAVVGLVATHRTHVGGWSDAEVRRVVGAAGAHLDDVVEVWSVVADESAFVSRLTDLGRTEDLASLEPALDGRAVMDHLGLRPGRDIGDALAVLTDIRLDEGVISRDEAFRRLDAWWAARQAT